MRIGYSDEGDGPMDIGYGVVLTHDEFDALARSECVTFGINRAAGELIEFTAFDVARDELERTLAQATLTGQPVSADTLTAQRILDAVDRLAAHTRIVEWVVSEVPALA